MKLFSEASDLYDSSGFAGDYYPGSTVADESAYTNAARNQTASRALLGDSSLNNAQNVFTKVMDSGSSIDDNAGYEMLTNGNNTGLNNLSTNSVGLNALNQYAQSTNPYIDALYQNAAEQKNAVINSNFEGNGRYGSGLQAAAIADTDESLANEMYSNAYNTAAEAANNAANAYTNQYSAAANAYTTQAKAAGDLYNTAVANDNTALNNAATQLLAIDNANQTATSSLAEAGSSLDDYNQSLVDANVDRYNYNQQQDAQNLQGYANMVSGGGYGGTTVTTTDGSK